MISYPRNGHSRTDRTFVGFGLGAIQAGLFLYEAQQSGAFARLVVAEVAPDVVAAVRAASGRFRVNIAHASGIEQAEVGPIEIYNPTNGDDFEPLMDALAAADEIATAVPSVRHYVGEEPTSLHRILAAGLVFKAERAGPHAVIYTAENHNHAAEILRAAIEDEFTRAATDAEDAEDSAQVQEQAADPEDARVVAEALAMINNRFTVVNTVIGKMSGVHPAGDGLAPVTPGSTRAFLVEEFNHILISKVRFGDGYAGFQRGLDIFEEKPDVLPFEEAKLYGHNALHALAGYLGMQAGVRYMADLVDQPGLIDFVRAAVLCEAGPALIRRHSTLGDPLFTTAGFAAYAEDLLGRMVNPWLRDPIERVCRDTPRKLGWDDRLVGTMRLALEADIWPERFALGAAAALAALEPHAEQSPAALLSALWQRPPEDAATVAKLTQLIDAGCARLDEWRAGGFGALDDLFPNQF